MTIIPIIILFVCPYQTFVEGKVQGTVEHLEISSSVVASQVTSEWIYRGEWSVLPRLHSDDHSPLINCNCQSIAIQALVTIFTMFKSTFPFASFMLKRKGGDKQTIISTKIMSPPPFSQEKAEEYQGTASAICWQRYEAIFHQPCSDDHSLSICNWQGSQERSKGQHFYRVWWELVVSQRSFWKRRWGPIGIIQTPGSSPRSGI